jgi:cell wall integrity and stress response component
VQGEDCWCGKSLPSVEDVVSDDKCDTECPGYVGDVCELPIRLSNCIC